ncbi:MAG: peptidylprolyl isomerase [Citromicrobium sp.]|nr:peptidylprolyl isomerase [Citromicrobium sp.]MBD76083.1 peptidylprolyl isomerase [Citromicrobium sp.]MBT46182.1 peptidylprolyl isomerase [Citromicrobium sp.]|tara:strand:+ start:240 stop:827 length:588 start_codon:yes stop_codon:yes gene_type:complete
MTEITRVPLRPIAKGSLAKLWIGVIVAVALAVLLAWSLAPKGVEVTVLEAGSGPSPSAGDVIFVNYTGKLEDGTVFDQSQPLPLPPQAQGLFPEGNPLPLDNMIPGFVEGATKMQKGGKYQLRIPANMAYGDEEKTNPQTGEVVIPANSDLIFDVDMIDFMTRAEFERRVQVITQMMQQQGGMMGPADGAAPPPQ